MNEISCFVDEFYNTNEKEHYMKSFFDQYEYLDMSLHDVHGRCESSFTMHTNTHLMKVILIFDAIRIVECGFKLFINRAKTRQN